MYLHRFALAILLSSTRLRIYHQALFDERISLYELASAIGSGVEQ